MSRQGKKFWALCIAKFVILEVIPNSEEIYQIISESATVKIVGKDCNVFGFKKCVNNTFKLTNR